MVPFFRQAVKQAATGIFRNMSTKGFIFQKALVFQKITKFGMHKHRNPHLTDDDIAEFLRNMGTDGRYILASHREHKKNEEKLLDALEKLDIETKVTNRFTIREEDTDWADAVIAIGGDGTFLGAASEVQHSGKLVFGFNSNPENSTGYLCLPKQHSLDIYNTLKNIKQGKFSWMFRTRIRVMLNPGYGHYQNSALKPLDEISDITYADETTVPKLALNEVYIGEKLSSRVSYLSFKRDDGELIHTKSSGLIVSTGSGSTSWHYTINQVSPNTVQYLFSLGNCPNVDVQSVVDKYNSSLIFNPEDTRLYYTIRDLVPTAEWNVMPNISRRGFTNTFFIKSSCTDAALVIDAERKYGIRPGATLYLQTFPNDALRTLEMNQSYNLNM